MAAHGMDGVDRVLDAGAGDAFFVRKLLNGRANARATCWDGSYTDAQLRELPALDPRFQFVRERPTGSFDLLLLMDVLEHVDDDRSFLGTLVEENLQPGARVLISVPAWQQLFSEHDVALKHFRRYHPRACADLIEASGLTILQSGGAFHSLVLARGAGLLKERLQRGRRRPATASGNLGQWKGGEVATAVIGGALRVDNLASHLFARVGVNVAGLTWWAICQKRS